MHYVPTKPTYTTINLEWEVPQLWQLLTSLSIQKLRCSQDIPNWICGEQTCTETGFSPSTPVLLYQYNSTNDQFSFLHPPLMSYYLRR